MRLEYWSVIFAPEDVYLHPTMQRKILHGMVYGSQNFSDGTWINTTELIAVDTDHVAATMSGSKYILGNVDPLYERDFPNAYERLVRVYRSH